MKWKTSLRNAFGGLAAALYLMLAGCATSDERPSDGEYVPIARYIAHLANGDLEALHRLQINDAAGLRDNLETSLGTDVQVIWATIQSESTSDNDRATAYGLLRLMAVQNEKFPVANWNADPIVLTIFAAAISNNEAHTDQLRRQDWSKGRWSHWVD